MQAQTDLTSHTVLFSKDQAQLTQALLTVCADIMLNVNPSNAVQQVCDEIVEQLPAVRLVWTWFGNPQTPVIRPQTIAGDGSRFATALSIDTSKISVISPVFNPIHGRKGQTFPVDEHSPYENWRKAACSEGIRSVFAVPLAAENATQTGVMVLYATEPDYFERLGTWFFEAIGHFTGALLHRQQHERALEQMAFYDSLTGQMNRNGLYSALQAHPQAGHCVMLEIDFFKTINDTHGHSVGDMVLSRLGHLINRHTLKRRQLDSNKGLEFYAARWGGEEFFMFIANAQSQQVIDWVESLRASISRMACQISDELTIRITASFGIAYCPDSHAMLRGAIEHADAALYQAKAAGRNCVVMQSH
jgi:diguanylate cyclase (GGDEF)-like protein